MLKYSQLSIFKLLGYTLLILLCFKLSRCHTNEPYGYAKQKIEVTNAKTTGKEK